MKSMAFRNMIAMSNFHHSSLQLTSPLSCLAQLYRGIMRLNQGYRQPDSGVQIQECVIGQANTLPAQHIAQAGV